jgi:glyoxylase-like metal-dependent hydrolase (beta-lactamase superfamily II)
MSVIHIIDLDFLGEHQAIGAFLIETNEGPILIEAGPESTWPQLKEGINRLGYEPEDIHRVFLTHIHFDHAGAAWKMAELGAVIYVHPLGLPHLASPERLWNSAAQIYGDDMDRLWGQMNPIPESQLIEVQDGEVLRFGELELKALHTPGHAVHHIAWQLGDCIFTGDVAGVKINQGPVVPPCPPPDIHLENWKASIALLRNQNANNFYLTHFGKITEPDSHLDELEAILDDWANWIKPFYNQKKDPQEIVSDFIVYTQGQLKDKKVQETDMQRYELANPSWMSVAGLLRYWKLKDQGRI